MTTMRDLELKRSKGLVPRGRLAKLRVAKRAQLRAENLPGRSDTQRGPFGVVSPGGLARPSAKQRRVDKLASYTRQRFGRPRPFI